MNQTKRNNLSEILQMYLPPKINERQLRDWLIKAQDDNYNFFPECTCADLRQCAIDAGIKLVKRCTKEELEIPIFYKRKKIIYKSKPKVSKFIGKYDIIEVYINQNKSHKETCKILHISSSRLQRLCKEYNIYKQKAC